MRQLLLVQFVFILAACASSPTQVEEAIATGYITVESLAESALTAYRGGYIDDSQRDEVADLLDVFMFFCCVVPKSNFYFSFKVIRKWKSKNTYSPITLIFNLY